MTALIHSNICPLSIEPSRVYQVCSPSVLMQTYSHSGDKRETHLMAHQRQHFIVSNSFSQRIMTFLKFLGTTSYTCTAWAETFKKLSGLQPCWSQWELKCTFLPRVIKAWPKGHLSWWAESLLTLRLDVEVQTMHIVRLSRNVFLHVQSASCQLLKALLSL